MREPYGRYPRPPAPRSRLERLTQRRHARRRRLLGIALVLVASVVTGAALVKLTNLVDGGPATSMRTGGVQTNAAGNPAASAAVNAAVGKCRTAWQSQTASRAAAKRSLAQWRVHIDAMNKLAAGKLTLDQAKQFWTQSRTGAKSNAAAFRTADLQYTRSPSRCAVPAGPGDDVSDLAAKAVAACRDAEAAANKELAQARTAIATWEMHIHHMEMLRAGQLNPSSALQLWLQNWRTGNAQVAAYDTAIASSNCEL